MRSKVIITILFMLCATWRTVAQTTNHQAFSVFVYGLSRYTSWPPAGHTEFTIAVIGKSKTYDEMIKNSAGKSIGGLPIKVVQVDDPKTVLNAQIIYLPDNNSSMLDEIKKLTDGKPVLIIAEREGLHKKGAGMSFIAIDSKLRLDINSKELQNRQIKIASQLQSLANEVI